ncbi:hypothetical protein TWF730_008937 [Orbilia blumenaviensis]|uniref:Uncharacterized protein n=1 Tax=Orbilia blumenaviensis TaxID=1796055 RepID=A0AAV9UWY0_9PEZI
MDGTCSPIHTPPGTPPTPEETTPPPLPSLPLPCKRINLQSITSPDPVPIYVPLLPSTGIFPYHITAIRQHLQNIKHLAGVIHNYCISIAPDDQEGLELGDPPSLRSEWVRLKYQKDTKDLISGLRLFIGLFPALAAFVYEYIPIHILGWLYTSATDEAAFQGLMLGRSRVLMLLETMIRRDIPMHMGELVDVFGIYLGEGGIFGRLPGKDTLAGCATQIMELCDVIGWRSGTMMQYVAVSERNIARVKEYVEGLERDALTGYFLLPKDVEEEQKGGRVPRMAMEERRVRPWEKVAQLSPFKLDSRMDISPPRDEVATTVDPRNLIVAGDISKQSKEGHKTKEATTALNKDSIAGLVTKWSRISDSSSSSKQDRQMGQQSKPQKILLKVLATSVESSEDPQNGSKTAPQGIDISRLLSSIKADSDLNTPAFHDSDETEIEEEEEEEEEEDHDKLDRGSTGTLPSATDSSATLLSEKECISAILKDERFKLGGRNIEGGGSASWPISINTAVPRAVIWNTDPYSTGPAFTTPQMGIDGRKNRKRRSWGLNDEDGPGRYTPESGEEMEVVKDSAQSETNRQEGDDNDNDDLYTLPSYYGASGGSPPKKRKTSDEREN